MRLTFATPLTQRKQNEWPHGNLTGLINPCKQILHSELRGVVISSFFLLPISLIDRSSQVSHSLHLKGEEEKKKSIRFVPSRTNEKFCQERHARHLSSVSLTPWWFFRQWLRYKWRWGADWEIFFRRMYISQTTHFGPSLTNSFDRGIKNPEGKTNDSRPR